MPPPVIPKQKQTKTNKQKNQQAMTPKELESITIEALGGFDEEEIKDIEQSLRYKAEKGEFSCTLEDKFKPATIRYFRNLGFKISDYAGGCYVVFGW